MDRSKLIIIISVVVVVVLLFLVWFGVLPGRRGGKPPAADLTFWGFTEDEPVWRDVIDGFKEKFPDINIEYRAISRETYEDTLLNALANGTGPDIFILQNTWVTKHRDKIAPLPQGLFGLTVQDFRNTFVDATSQDLVFGNTILGLPVYIDTPVLFYNKDIFNAAGIAIVPKNWDEVLQASKKLVQKNQAGDISAAGIALGTSKNISRLFEILSSLFLQSGDSILDPVAGQMNLDKGSESALDFYTSFADPAKDNYTWNNRMPNSLDAFTSDRAAMALGISEDIPLIQAKNPHLNFGVAPLPQTPGTSHPPVVFGTYLFPTVSKSSPNPRAAWQFLLFATTDEGVKIYLNETNRPSANRRIIAEGTDNDALQIFLRQALIAKSWAVPDDLPTRRSFQNAVEAVITKALTPEQALSQIRDQVGLLIP